MLGHIHVRATAPRSAVHCSGSPHNVLATLVIRACSAREATCRVQQWVLSASQFHTLGEGGEESLGVVRSLIPTLSNPLSIHFKLLKM